MTSRTSNVRRWSREQYLSCFQAISRWFWGGLRFVLSVGFCTKRRSRPNSLKTANVIVSRFCFGRESCSCCFRRISRRFWKGVFLIVLSVGFCTKRRPWPNSLKTANIIVLRFCFRLESCLIYFQAISRWFWKGLRFWVFGLRFVPTPVLNS